jgi:hypothetical protein
MTTGEVTGGADEAQWLRWRSVADLYHAYFTGLKIRQATWKLMADVADYHPACAKVLEGLFEGLAAGCGRHIAVDMRPAAGGKPPFMWSIG